MRFRKLRIAWSVAWGIPCVLLMVLWVRSYWRVDGIYLAHSHAVVSMQGDLYIDAGVASPIGLGLTRINYGSHVLHLTWQLGEGITLNEERAVVPIWAILLPLALCSTVSWLPWRFSLRTLLIAITLVAVVLGVVVWAAR